ncbi:MAG: hypothetical protein IJX99_09505 [Clostridia bacterium]|nr:hypothetical protein [Clostridia bacterium]
MRFFNKESQKIIKDYEELNYLQVEDLEVLPKAEQERIIGGFLRHSYRGGRKLSDEEKQELEEAMVIKIVDKLNDPRLKNSPRINSNIFSTGGAKNNGIDADKNVFSGGKTKYVAIEINGIIILEAINQMNNATFITTADDSFGSKMRLTRDEAASSGELYRIYHGGEAASVEDRIDSYDYESNHLLRVLEMAIVDPERLLRMCKSSEC